MGRIIGSVIVGIPAIVCFFISCRQFKEKGFLFNNEYIYASKTERETMDKKPHYRQSGIVFLLLGIIFSIVAIEIITYAIWLFYFELVIIAATIIYAIVSSVKIEKRTK